MKESTHTPPAAAPCRPTQGGRHRRLNRRDGQATWSNRQMTARTTIKLKPSAPPRDPRRPRVRGAAPLPTKVAPKSDGAVPGRRPTASRPATDAAAAAPLRPGPAGQAPAPRPPAPAAPAQAAPAGPVRLSKLLSDRGLASRRQADDWIAAGCVRVDGEPATLGQRVLPSQRIDIDPAAKAEPGRSGSKHRIR